MRVLVVHHESRYFAGAEVLLGHFLAGLKDAGVAVAAAVVRESRTASAIPTGVQAVWIRENQKFSPGNFGAQLRALVRAGNAPEFDVIHGWAVRDWELAAAAGKLGRRPAIGTLHDHPRAPFLSNKRQKFMRLVANRGLDRVICISDAVRNACRDAGYHADKLEMVHNGIPVGAGETRHDHGGVVRLGFLGVFSERKGLRGLFEMIEHLSALHPSGWELTLAGAADGRDGDEMIASIRARYSGEAWWPRIRWCGWIKDQNAFLSQIDVLVCPFREFEPFGLVLCEAAAARLPVVATDVGAVREIVEDGKTGWLFQAGDWERGGRILADVIRKPHERIAAGTAARGRVEQHFNLAKMISGYMQVYSELSQPDSLPIARG